MVDQCTNYLLCSAADGSDNSYPNSLNFTRAKPDQ